MALESMSTRRKTPMSIQPIAKVVDISFAGLFAVQRFELAPLIGLCFLDEFKHDGRKDCPISVEHYVVHVTVFSRQQMADRRQKLFQTPLRCTSSSMRLLLYR